MLRRSLIIDPKDTVAVLLENAVKGDVINTPQGEITLLEDIEFAHKAAIIDHEAKQKVCKYGYEIGYMAEAVPKGTWIHNHNMRCDRGR
jgi:hypothetical protein